VFSGDLTHEKTVDNLQVTLKMGALKTREIHAFLHSKIARRLGAFGVFKISQNR
jgi:hypothetical protein